MKTIKRNKNESNQPCHKKINEQKLQRENKKEKPKDLNKIV